MTRQGSRLARVLRGISVALLAAWSFSGALAQVPDKINYQGKLTDSAGQPINTTVSVVFHLYNVASGGSALYTETQTVTVANGLFNVAIGSVTPLGLAFDVPYYLGVKVGTDAEMTPRQAVLSSPYALQAASAEGLAAAATVGGGQITGAISTATLPAGNLSGTIGTAQIANNAVTQAKLSPSSGGTAGKVLGTDGTNLVWQSAASGSVGGSGTTNFVAKWTPNGATLGNSAIFESNGLVGFNTSSLSHNVEIFGASPQINIQDSVSGTTALLSRYTGRFEISPSDGFQVSVGGVGLSHFWVGSDGRVGIGTTAPGNKLEIGSVAGSGFGGNDIAFGNGTQASAIAQTPSVAWWYSNTDIALMPRGDGHGRVGINTVAPVFTLEVRDFVDETNAVFEYLDATGLHNGHIAPQTSIFAEHNVVALEFDVLSDARIKNVVGVSDSTKDLATINALQVTDYTLKDRAANGDRPFKKVIAQQVEMVYPQVVSRHVDFIPNVYQAASKVTRTDRGILLHFDNAHHLTAQAKRVKLLVSGEHTMQRVTIGSIPSERDVLIETMTVNSDKVFVYGEEVDDFRTVDYEGLAMLNISATQELSKRLQEQAAEIAMLKQQLARMAQLQEQDARLAALEARLGVK